MMAKNANSAALDELEDSISDAVTAMRAVVKLAEGMTVHSFDGSLHILQGLSVALDAASRRLMQAESTLLASNAPKAKAA